MLKFESAEQLIKDIISQFEETLASGCVDIKQSKIIFKENKADDILSEKALVDFAVSSLSALSKIEPMGFLFTAEFKNQTVFFAKKLTEHQFLYIITHKSVFPLLNLYLKNIEYSPGGSHATLESAVPDQEPYLKKEIENEDMMAAKRIQQIMLSDPKILSKAFSKQFLFYKPHDSIGGDFYVFKKIKENYLIVVGDCTGHGVEGALSSMTVSSILNQLLVKNNPNLSEVIKNLYKQLENYNMNQQTEDNHYGIGVDLAILNYDTVAAVADVVTSGVLVQHLNGSSNKLIKHRKVKDSLFSSDKIALKKGDRLYVYSDGLADQFDKNDKKKLGSNGVISLIEGMKNFTESEFSKVFTEWRGSTPQIDDITILGLTI